MRSQSFSRSDPTVAIGLSESEAVRRFEQFGPNELTQYSTKSAWQTLSEQLAALMMMILICATIISALLVDYKDSIAIGDIVRMPIPLLPLQILWMNLVTDGLPALALSVEPAESTTMCRPPVQPEETIFIRDGTSSGSGLL
jgi:magnesium-transporting ATPase (P-type)